ncbi:hypothetical protein Syun_027977 [Stephania yunnanensis]|uniref:Uncharacterized protein n=1 Tax=Stephania yunnanensis TaxID=152371 RepID=A0AAP0EGI5_9MAGN
MDKEVKQGLYDTLDKNVPIVAERVVVDEEITKFKKGEGMFSREIAKLTRDKKQLAPSDKGKRILHDEEGDEEDNFSEDSERDEGDEGCYGEDEDEEMQFEGPRGYGED